MKLPYLAESNWPISKESEEKIANPSYERQIEDHLIDEILVALEKKDTSRLKEAFEALILHCQAEE